MAPAASPQPRFPVVFLSFFLVFYLLSELALNVRSSPLGTFLKRTSDFHLEATMLPAPSGHLVEGGSWGLRVGIREEKKRSMDVFWNPVPGRAQSHQSSSHKPEATRLKPLVKAVAQER